MFRKLQLRFIGLATLVVALILGMFWLLINSAVYAQTESNIQTVLSVLTDNDGQLPMTEEIKQDLTDKNIQEGIYLFQENIYYLEEEGKIFIDIYKKEIDILFNDYFYLTKNILESKIIQNFLNLYPPLKLYCVLKSAPVLEFKGPELAWNSLLFIYDSKQASIRLNISF